MTDSTQELLDIHEQQRKEEEEALQREVDESQARLRHRLQLANEDPGLNLDINDEYLEGEDDNE